MSAKPRIQRLQVMLTDVELEALDNWRYKKEMPTRASAIRELLKRGLAAEGFEVSDRSIKSHDYGIIPKS